MAKILFISPHSFELSTGGVERHVKNLIKYAQKSSEESYFVFPARNVQSESIQSIGNVKIFKKNFLNILFKRSFGKKDYVRNDVRAKAGDFFLFLREIIAKEKIDIISAEDFHTVPPPYSLMLNMICFLEKIPLFLVMHTFIKDELQKVIAKDLLWEKILCVSKSVASDCFNKEIPIDNLHTQYLGVDNEEFRPDLDKKWLKSRLGLPMHKKIILHASRVVSETQNIIKEKGFITLVEAFSQIASKYPDIVLLLAVARPKKAFFEEFKQAVEKIKGYAQLFNISDRIIIKEFSLEEMPLVYGGAEIFVLASEMETFGQVYLEAMACGTPVIGTNIGGVPEIITDNFNGFLIEQANPSLLSQKIDLLLSDNWKRNVFIENGLKLSRTRFSAMRQFSMLFNYLSKFPKKKIQETFMLNGINLPNRDG